MKTLLVSLNRVGRIGLIVGAVGSFLAVAVIAGCNKTMDTAAKPARATAASPANMPPEAQAQIQKGIQQGQADGAAYAARMKALTQKK